MLKRVVLGALVFIFCLSLPLCAADKPIKWRAVTHQPAGTLRYETFVDFCKTITEASGGRLVVEPFAGGMLFPVMDTFDAVKSGTVPMASISSGFWSGKNLAFAWHAGRPGCPILNFDESIYLYEKTSDFARELYKMHGITYLGASQWAPPEQLLGVVPIRTLDDLKGKRIRSHGISAGFYTRLGASAVSTSPSEVYTALQTKQVDLAEYNDWAINKQLNLQEVVKYVTIPGMHYSSIEEQSLIVNPKAWDALPGDLQQIILAAKDKQLCMSAISNGVESIKARREWEKLDSIEIIELSKEDIAKARQVGLEMLLEDSENNDKVKEYMELYAEVLSDLGYNKEASTLGHK